MAIPSPPLSARKPSAGLPLFRFGPEPVSQLALWQGKLEDACKRIARHPFNMEIRCFFPLENNQERDASEAKGLVQLAAQHITSHVSPDIFLEPEIVQWLSLPQPMGSKSSARKAEGPAPGDSDSSSKSLRSKREQLETLPSPVILAVHSQATPEKESASSGFIMGVAEGTMLLSLNEQVRTRLGIESQRSKSSKNRFFARLVLDGDRVKVASERKMGSGQKLPRNYARWKWCLSRLRRMSFSISLPLGQKIPKIIQHKIKNCGELKIEKPITHSQTMKDVWFPLLSEFVSARSIHATDVCNSIEEYFGHLSIGVKPAAEYFQNSLGPGRISDMLVSSTTLRIHSTHVIDLVKRASGAVSRKKYPWACVGVRGCRSAPTSWNMKDLAHDGILGGGSENDFFIFCLPGNVCWILYMLGSKDTSKR